MHVTVRLFAILKDKAGQSQLRLTMEGNPTVADAMTQIAQAAPAVAIYLPRVATAVNQEYAPATRPLKDGDELALIPAVSGGNGSASSATSIGERP